MTIEDAAGQEVADYRPPYGIFSFSGLRAIRRLGWRPVLWSRWGGTWTRGATPASIADRVSARVRGGDIVLLHDADFYSAPGSWLRTVAGLPIILEELEARGLKIEAAPPLSRWCRRPLIAAGECFVESLRHRAPGPVLVEDLLCHQRSVL